MITQTIKNWLRKLFAWWPWKEPADPEYSPVTSTLNIGTPPGSASRSVIDGVAPQTGMTPRLSTMEDWPERVAQPGFLPASERLETPLSLPPPPPPSPPIVETVRETPLPVNSGDPPALVDPSPSSTPTAQQQLEFLHYLVKRGIVNEGFEEGHVPEQYRRE